MRLNTFIKPSCRLTISGRNEIVLCFFNFQLGRFLKIAQKFYLQVLHPILSRKMDRSFLCFYLQGERFFRINYLCISKVRIKFFWETNFKGFLYPERIKKWLESH